MEEQEVSAHAASLGLHWARSDEELPPIIALYPADEWEFGDGEDPEHEDNLQMQSIVLTPPDAKRAAGWKGCCEKPLAARRTAGDTDPLAGWAYLDGDYWVRTPKDGSPVLAQCLEGWGGAAGSAELASADVIGVLARAGFIA